MYIYIYIYIYTHDAVCLLYTFCLVSVAVHAPYTHVDVAAYFPMVQCQTPYFHKTAKQLKAPEPAQMPAASTSAECSDR